ncbi:MAG: hypothetical protein KA715_06510 [Xanthomonadaceae bacterium]|nr:hypothetical protein [Xanthomonadaceae bacterium]
MLACSLAFIPAPALAKKPQVPACAKTLTVEIDSDLLNSKLKQSAYAGTLLKILKSHYGFPLPRPLFLNLETLKIDEIESLILSQHFDTWRETEQSDDQSIKDYLNSMKSENDTHQLGCAFDPTKFDAKSGQQFYNKRYNEALESQSMKALLSKHSDMIPVTSKNAQAPAIGAAWNELLVELKRKHPELKYNKAKSSLFNLTDSGRLNCYSGTLLFQLSRLKAQEKNLSLFKNESLFAVLASNHVLTGVIDQSGQMKSLEHTAQADEFNEGIVGKFKKPMRILNSKDYLALTAIESMSVKSSLPSIGQLLCRSQYQMDKQITESQLKFKKGEPNTQRSFVQDCADLIPKARKSENVDGSGMPGLNSSYLAWGDEDDEVPEGDLDLGILNSGISNGSSLGQKQYIESTQAQNLTHSIFKGAFLESKSFKTPQLDQRIGRALERFRIWRDEWNSLSLEQKNRETNRFFNSPGQIPTFHLLMDVKDVDAKSVYYRSVTMSTSGLNEGEQRELLDWILNSQEAQLFLIGQEPEQWSFYKKSQYNGKDWLNNGQEIYFEYATGVEGRGIIELPLSALKKVLSESSQLPLYQDLFYENKTHDFEFSGQDAAAFKALESVQSNWSKNANWVVNPDSEKEKVGLRALRDLGFYFEFDPHIDSDKALAVIAKKIDAESIKSLKILRRDNIKKIICTQDVLAYAKTHYGAFENLSTLILPYSATDGCVFSQQEIHTARKNDGSTTNNISTVNVDRILTERSQYLLKKRVFEQALSDLLDMQVSLYFEDEDLLRRMYPNDVYCPAPGGVRQTSCTSELWKLYGFLKDLDAERFTAFKSQLKENAVLDRVVISYNPDQVHLSSSYDQKSGKIIDRVERSAFIQKLDGFGVISFLSIGSLPVRTNHPLYNDFMQVQFDGVRHPQYVDYNGILVPVQNSLKPVRIKN